MRRQKITPKQMATPIAVAAIFVAAYLLIWTGVANSRIAGAGITDCETGETEEIEDRFSPDLMNTNYAVLASAVSSADTVRMESAEGEPYCIFELFNRNDVLLYEIDYTDAGIYLTDGKNIYAASGKEIEALPGLFLKDTGTAYADAGSISSARITLPDGQKKTLPVGITVRLAEALEDASAGTGTRLDFRQLGVYSITCSDDAGMETATILVYKGTVWLADLKAKEYIKLEGMDECLGWIEDFYGIER